MEIKYENLKQEEKSLFNLIDSLIIQNGKETHKRILELLNEKYKSLLNNDKKELNSRGYFN